MTLAAILLIGISWTIPTAPGEMGQTSASSTQTAPSTQDQTTTPAQSPAPQATPLAPGSSATKSRAAHSGAKKTVHKKQVASPGCDAPATNSTPSPNSTSKGTSSTSDASAQQAATTKSPTNCPPEKIVVKHGGTTEPSIQLAGGPGGQQASQTRDETTRMLAETETNLKKVAGQQLTANQKDSVTQVHQFADQSRSALAAGDNERAKTLATKAKLLSEDLVQPQK